MSQTPDVRQIAVIVLVAASAAATGCRDATTVGEGADGGATADAGAVEGPVARWQPPDGPLPTPTDYRRTSDGERLEVPEEGAANEAEAVYRRYLDGLDGYPLTADVDFPIDGALAPATMADNVVGIDRSGWSVVDLEAEWRPAESRVRVSRPDATFRAGRRYAFALRGGTAGIAGPSGAPLGADHPFEFVRGDRSLDDAPASWSDDLVDRLGGLRDSYEPVFEYLADEQDVSRASVAAMTQFRTSRRAAVWFDPGSGRMPIPNDYLYDRDDEQLDLPERAGVSEEVAAIRRAISTYDGFSTSAPMFTGMTEPIDGGTFGRPKAFRLFRRGESGWRPVDRYRTGVFDGGETVWAEPTPALEPDARYAYVVTGDLESRAGEPVRAQPASALLRSEAELTDDDGGSRLDFLSDEVASKLEWLRSRAAGLVQMLVADGRDRSSVAAVVPFRTMDVLDEHLRRRARLYEKPVSTDIVDTEAKSPLDRGMLVAMPQVETVVTGRMTTLDFLDPTTRAFREDGSAREREIAFALTIPEGVDEGEEIPVVLFGHGLTTSRELVYLIADRMAEAGYATLAIDLPYHGERSVCGRDRQCRGDATCDERGVCRGPNGDRGELRRVEAPSWLWEESPTYPISSGRTFIDLDDMVATRDHFAQAMVDLMQALRVIRGADWRAASGGWQLDGDDVVYLGMSLGGILGANLAAVEPALDDFALNVPGGDFMEMIANSQALGGRYRSELDERGLEEGSDAFLRFVHRAHWLLDPVDPMNLGRYATERSFEYRKPGTDETVSSGTNRVLIQMAEGDSVVPNASTEILADRMNVDISRYSPGVSNHGFVFSPTSIDGKEARDEIIEFFERRSP